MKSAYVGVLSIIELKNARWNIEINILVLIVDSEVLKFSHVEV